MPPLNPPPIPAAPQAPSTDSEDPLDLFTQAGRSAKAGDLARAEQFYEAVKRIDPNGYGIEAAQRIQMIRLQGQLAKEYQRIADMLIADGLEEDARATYRAFLKKPGSGAFGDPLDLASRLVVTLPSSKPPTLSLNDTGNVSELLRAWQASLAQQPASDPEKAVTEHLRTAPFLLPGATRIDKYNIEQIYVPSGTFMMGSDPARDPDALPDEQPLHEVHITRDFWLDQFLVTNAAFQVFVTDGGYHRSEFWTPEGWAWCEQVSISAPENYKELTDPTQPRVGISWYEASAYAHWRGGRLASEAEWEYAARGPNASLFPWGDEFDINRLNTGRHIGKTTVVDAYPNGRSWIGAYDLSGNTWEWVADWHDKGYYGKKIATDPRGPSSGIQKVMRGGAWDFNPNGTRSAYRGFSHPNARSVNIGFRVLLSID